MRSAGMGNRTRRLVSEMCTRVEVVVIPLTECVARGVYHVDARNFDLAVFDGDDAFVGVRHKFSSTYLFGEFHYESDDTFGSCRPLKLIEMLPEGIDVLCDVRHTWIEDGVEMSGLKTYEPLFDYLVALQKRLKTLS